ncbi:hypothetical protein HYDPIDRAFT_114321 [Hydnomerulius pinastri MD-312]|uniref:Uncharacterized protein n=1 Tax=Hydnomerulius pinastri MD-312 TaxID=994086 RepID=A0A0C9VWV6_9AGAM|nr:hypothetical protein HYDPIDRAFT_114321 [Hydnomerulius pinastri MD-312]
MLNTDFSLLTEFNHFPGYPADRQSFDFTGQEEKWLGVYNARVEYFKAHEPSRHSTDSPCSSSATLLNEDNDRMRADVSKLIRSPQEERGPDTHIHAPVPTKPSFNPNAAPFVPSLATLNAARGQTPSQMPPVPVNPNWIDSYRQGTSIENSEDQNAAAQRMIMATKWSFGNICALAQMFCWECARPSTCGSFARAVYDALNTHYGEWESSCFRFHLHKCAIESFRITWSTVHPQAISAKNPPTPEYLQYACNLSAFVAELFAAGLIPETPITRCLGTLLREMCSIEHVFVLQDMVLRAKGALWQGLDSHELVKEFITSFTQRTSSIPDHASLGPPGSIADMVKEADIARKIFEWHSRRPAYPTVVKDSIWS